MKNLIAILLLSFLISCSNKEKTISEHNFSFGSLEDVGLSSSFEEKLDSYIQLLIDDKRIAGGVCLLAKDDMVVHFKTYGLKDIENNLEMDKGSIFRLASMTKPVVAVAAMMLYEEGLISLDDPVSKYIPEMRNLKVCIPPWTTEEEGLPMKLVDADTLRIKHLLNHSSGYTAEWFPGDIGKMYSLTIDNFLAKKYNDLAEYVKDVVKIPLVHQPGAKFEYGWSYDILGYLIEIVSNQTLDEFMREKIFDPLNMKSAGFNVPEEASDKIALYYSARNGDLEYWHLWQGQECTNIFVGGVGLSSTIEDYYVFCKMLLQKGDYEDVRILKESTVELMTQVTITANINWMKGYDFGLGFAIRTNNAEAQMMGSLGEFGWVGMFGTAFWIDPQKEIIGLLFTQGDPLNNYPPYNQSIEQYYYASKKMRDIVYRALEN